MATRQKKRDYYFDNAKFLLIALVVIGHAIRPLIDQSKFLNTLYLTIYTFHMPLFILIAGYFSKNYHKKEQNKKVISAILIPYIIFQTLYSIFNSLLNPPLEVEVSAFDPYWIMWFLLSLFLWRVLLPYFVLVKYPVLVAFALAVFIGYINEADDFLSLSRTIAFFPFFLAGFYLERSHFEKLFSPLKRIVGIGTLIGIFFLMYAFEYYLAPDFDFRRWLYFDFPYEELDHNEWYAGVYRIGLIVLSAIASLAFLAVVPRRQLWMTPLGSRSIYVYLWHGFFIELFKDWGPKDKLDNLFHYSLVVFGAILLTVLLASRPFQRLTRPLVRPNVDWIFSKEASKMKHVTK